MGAEGNWYVWEWLRPDGEAVYVGASHKLNGIHPADFIWETRYKLFKSELSSWLTKQPEQPKRSDDMPIGLLSEPAARAIWQARISKRKKAGIRLLTSRGFGTWRGGGTLRPVLSPEGNIYASVRQAAHDVGVYPGTITRRCQDQTSGWKYL